MNAETENLVLEDPSAPETLVNAKLAAPSNPAERALAIYCSTWG